MGLVDSEAQAGPGFGRFSEAPGTTQATGLCDTTLPGLLQTKANPTQLEQVEEIELSSKKEDVPLP